MLKMFVNNKPLMDSGSGISILPHAIFREIFDEFPVQETIIRTHFFEKSVIVPEKIFVILGA